ncbi:Uma2 family endonuclease [Phormidium sp. FACHB-1136]|uniref:Uma2 family endonuclease n=1 Tax=Phormidium sp. FACHB-1136 TaxID=2692848 RepID=UPI00321FA535
MSVNQVRLFHRIFAAQWGRSVAGCGLGGKSRIEAIAPDHTKVLSLAPDFVIELRSATDKLTTLERKMAEYRDCGVRLG